MIFAPESIASSNAGQKTKTREPVRKRVYVGGLWHADLCRKLGDPDGPLYPPGACLNEKILEVVHRGRTERLKWRVGRTYAMQLRRTKKAVARFLLKSIRCECIRDISDEDALAEGVRRRREGPDQVEIDRFCALVLMSNNMWHPTARRAFLASWKRWYPRSELTELVWVLEYEMVKS